MEIIQCKFRVEHNGGRVTGEYSDGKVSFKSTAGIPDDTSLYKGSACHTEEDQALYLDLLENEVNMGAVVADPALL